MPNDVEPAQRGPYAKSAARKRHIVAAAGRVFSQQGYRAGSLREVAHEAGMSMSTLMHHFPHKDDLLLAVLTERDRHPIDAPALTADTLIEYVVTQARANESIPGLVALYSVLAAESTTAEHPARGFFIDRFERMRRDFVAAFEQAKDRGGLRDGVEPRTAADGLIALWDGIQLRWLLQPDEVDVAGQLRAYLELLITPGSEGDARPHV